MLVSQGWEGAPGDVMNFFFATFAMRLNPSFSLFKIL